MKKTKIIATIGPSSQDIDIIRQMILEGTDSLRVNMKHASHEFLKDIKDKLDKLNDELKTCVSLIMDTRGPDITVGSFVSGQAYLNKDDKIRIYMNPIIGDSTKFSVSYSNLVNEVKCNSFIKLNDGLIELQVLDKGDDFLVCKVLTGGYIQDNKGVNILNVSLDLPFLSEKDIEDIRYASKIGVDYVALSRVSCSEDILDVNDLLIDCKNDDIGILAKIETEKAVEDIDAILNVCDGMIVARGDLGVEVPMERIPGIQKSIISKCHTAGKISIVATEMLSSMEQQARPTRAEVSDVANAVLDSCDAVMLSGETTIGKYPVETVSMMSKIVESSEYDVNYYELTDKAMRTQTQDTTGMLSYSVTECANRLKTVAIVAPTMSGHTAKKMSRFRPMCPIIAMSPNDNTAKNLSLYYAVCPVKVNAIKNFDQIMTKSKEVVSKLMDIETGNKIIITGGYPFQEVKHTNFMKIEEL